MKKSFEVRSDHLLAVFEYARAQMVDSGIDVLDFGPNQNALDSDEQLEYIHEIIQDINRLTFNGHCPLTVSKE